MNQQEFNKQSIEGVKKIGEGALEMIGSLERMVKGSFSKMGEAEAVKFAEMLKASQADKKLDEFKKELKNLATTFNAR